MILMTSNTLLDLTINVPSGTHKYELIPLENNTILARILFPKKDIKLEEN